MVSEHSCVKIDDDLPLATVALVGCGVPTGWGTAVNAGGVRPGDTTVVYGIGGVGINAVQGAAFAGARNVLAVDPLEFKRENAMEFGATHTAADAETAQQIITEVTRGVGADQALITVGVVTEEVIAGRSHRIQPAPTRLAPAEEVSAVRRPMACPVLPPGPSSRRRCPWRLPARPRRAGPPGQPDRCAIGPVTTGSPAHRSGRTATE